MKNNSSFQARFSPVYLPGGKKAVCVDFCGSCIVWPVRGNPSAWYAVNANCWYQGELVTRNLSHGAVVIDFSVLPR